MIIEASAVNVLFLTQEVDTNIKILAVEHLVSISDAVGTNLLPQQASSALYLTQGVNVQKILNFNITHTIEFVEGTHPRSSNLEAGNFLFMWGEAINHTQWPIVIHSINLAQSVTVIDSKAAASVIALEQEVTVTKSLNLQVTDTLTLNQGANTYIPRYCWNAYDINVVEP